MKYGLIAFVTLGVFCSASFAELKPEEKITFRQSGFTFMRWNMGIIKSQVVDNPASYRKEGVVSAANTVSAIAHSGIETLFTPDTETGKGWKDTRVKSEFFKNPDDVKKRVADLKTEASALAKVAGDGDIIAIKTQLDKVQKVCKGCHEEYRTKD